MQRHGGSAYKEITLQQLRSFCTTARAGSFKAAADFLGLAHPTVWQQVHSLERQLGVQLVEPHKRGCRLTEEGRLLIDLAGAVVHGIDELPRHFQEAIERVHPRLTVATTQRILMEELSAVIPVFERRCPNARLCFREHNSDHVIEAVEAGDADLGITTSPEPKPVRPLLLFETAYQLHVLLVTPRDHPLARRRRVCPEDLRGFPIVNFPGCFRDPAINALLEKFAVLSQPRKVEVGQAATVRHFVALGFGVGLTLGIPASGLNGNLHERSMSRYFGFSQANLIWRKGTHRHALARTFVEVLQNQLPARSE
jgi:DNA-binding transcriptional LysR family regulator